jgi:hypothetical protein
VTVANTQASTLTITSLPLLPQGATVVSAKLVGPGGTPVVGRIVKFTAGTVTATGVTNASGIASATLTLKPGLYTLGASFAGDTAFTASAASAALVVYAKESDGKGDGGGTDGKGGGSNNGGSGNGGSKSTGGDGKGGRD